MVSPVMAPTISLSFQPLSLRLKHPFGTASGTSADSHNLLVKLHYKDWIGYGEASPVWYHAETIETASSLLAAWQSNEELLGHDPFAITAIEKRMNAVVSGHASVKAAVEMALHDLCGKILKVSVLKMLGLSGFTQPMTDFTIGIDSLAMIEQKTNEAIAAGFQVLKVKLGTAYDKEIIKSVRSVTALPLRVDANGAWTPKQAIAMAHLLAQENVQLIEQPLPKSATVDDFRFVKEHSPLPIFADESVSTSSDVARFANAVDGVVIKLAKTGGIAEAMRCIHTARAHGMQIMLGCMVESSLGISAALQLSSLVDYLDLDGALLLAQDPFYGSISCNQGRLTFGDGVGLGACLHAGSASP